MRDLSHHCTDNRLLHGQQELSIALAAELAMTILTYGPGESVPHPGVYAVIHGKPHMHYKEAFVDGATFPSCHTCSSQVIFRLIRAVENISQDTDFRPDGSNAIRKTA